MNTNSEDRFHELAHKALAEDTLPAQQEELRALVAENPKLKDELDQMRAEVAVAREILPLLEDIQRPLEGTPGAPMARLRKEIAEVFEESSAWKTEVQGLLGKLEKWAGRVTGTEREHLMAAIAAVRQALSARGKATCWAAAALPPPRTRTREMSASMKELRARLLAEEDMIEADPAALENRPDLCPAERATEGKRRAELELRLRQLEDWIGEAEEAAHRCRAEARVLRELLSRERGSADL
jgi:chromosome segregation ATPase